MSLYIIKEHLINVILIPKSKVLLLKILDSTSVRCGFIYLNLLDTYKHFIGLLNHSKLVMLRNNYSLIERNLT